MASWRMNQGFLTLNKALREKYPNIVIYGIGDPAHQAKTSDHNPNKYGRVNAEDYMLRNGFDHADAVWLCSWLTQDNRTKYVIFNRRIWQSGKWSTYTGENPHTDHVHHSVYDDADNDTTEWKLEKDMPVQDDVWNYDIDASAKTYSAKGALKTVLDRSAENRENIEQLMSAVAALTADVASIASDVKALKDSGTK